MTQQATNLGPLVRADDRVELRRHIPANREAFVRWYQDEEIAMLLRHDLKPLTLAQARTYFDSIVLPSTARNTCWAIHERESGRLVGSTALTEVDTLQGTGRFRIVLGEKDTWNQGFGTAATQLVAIEANLNLQLTRILLEVFSHNQRALRAYLRAGFVETGSHTEWIPRLARQLHVIEMELDLAQFMHPSAANDAAL